jgi:hypothetical protein
MHRFITELLCLKQQKQRFSRSTPSISGGQTVQLVEHLTGDSKGVGLNPGLVHCTPPLLLEHYYMCITLKSNH